MKNIFFDLIVVINFNSNVMKLPSALRYTYKSFSLINKVLSKNTGYLYNCIHFISGPNPTKTTEQLTTRTTSPNFEIETIKTKLEDYNFQLNRSLKTLEYVQLMENSTKNSTVKHHFGELFSLKTRLEKQILKASQKISHYKLLLETSVA